MTVDPTIIPGSLILVLELLALAAVGFVVVRVALRQSDDRIALAQGLVVGPALWILIVNFMLHLWPGLTGAVVGWAVTLALGAGLVWRAPHPIRPRPRVAAGFVVAALALFWIALASRQLLAIPDIPNHLGLAASIRAGGFPPAFFWTPSVLANYHHGQDLLIGLLAPPVGPDLAFTTELLDAWSWTSFVLVVVTALLRRASAFAVLVAAPLLLSAGAWSFTSTLVDIVQIPVPAGLPAAGLRASLADVYWPSVQLPWTTPYGGLPDIWLLAYPVSYGLTFVVLERAARAEHRSWLAYLTLAGLVGCVGLLSTTLAPLVLVMWAGLEAVHLVQARRAGAASRAALLRAAAGLALAALLLSVGGGALATFMAGSVQSGLSLRWSDDPGALQPLTSFDLRPGGVGLLGLGPLVIAGVAVLLAWRDRLVVGLALGAALLALTALALFHESLPGTLTRLMGHARNFALLALLLALTVRLAHLRPPRWRYAAGAVLLVVVTWPTVAVPVRNLGLAIGQGVDLANAQPLQYEPGERHPHQGRTAMPFVSDRVAAYIQDHTPVDARVLPTTPDDGAIAYATGRPNAAGFTGLVHTLAFNGPEYLDVLDYLEPAALRRLGIAYLHATDAWVADLPDQSARWLADPRFFELLIRDGSEALYRVRPEFLRLDAAPALASFEALRRAVPASATVYLPPPYQTVDVLRAASTLSHAQILGTVDPTSIHLLTPWPAEPLDRRTPDLVIASPKFVPWMFPPAGRQPIWWNDEVAVYAPHGAVAPIMPAPPELETLPVSVRLSDANTQDGRLTFTATFDDRAPGHWSGQDWVVVAGDASSWAIPSDLLADGRTPMSAGWFSGQIGPGVGTTTRTFELEGPASRLAVQDSNGVFTEAAAAGDIQGPGSWMLAVRLRHEWQPQYWRLVALIPVLQIDVSDAGDVYYRVYQDPLSVRFPP